MRKYLNPETIIPQDLYVSRKADEQINNIIQNMGRPGYILVSRQMGKTNLLINAKRNLQTDKDIISYIDLSNKFDSARDCFRNIIDIIIDTNSQQLEQAERDILLRRDKSKLSEHKEHSFELRRLLRDIEGKLVISLDEIDSLTQASYSDKIFAQIRSVYFDRVNFSEFNRLTYILSGVAEPSDIIKDSSISPFNIGQKIFLGDFTQTEYKEFILKSKINLSEDLEDRIFHWTNGNPRLTWDICSEVEDLINLDIDVKCTDIDEIVHKNYLKKFDKPPIDHIRTLISKDVKLRNGIVSIKYGKIDSLTDEIKSKLYLAGVLDSNYEEGEVKIKNRIIDSALADDWLESLDKLEEFSINSADNLFSNGNYLLAINQYKDLLQTEENLTYIEENQIYYKLAASFHHTMNYSEVIKYSDTCKFNAEENKSIYLELLWFKANAYDFENNKEEAKKLFKKIIELDKNSKSDLYYRSSLDLISLYRTDINLKDTLQLVTDLILELQNEFNKIKPILKPNEISFYLSLSYYLEGTIQAKLSENKLACSSFQHSLKHANENEKFLPLLKLLKVSEILKLEDDVFSYYEKIINLLKNNEIKIQEQSKEFVLSDDVIKDIIIFSAKKFNIEKTTYLLNVLSETIKIEGSTIYSLILEAAGEAIRINDQDTALLILKYLFSNDRKKIGTEEYFTAAKWISYYVSDNEDAKEVYFQGAQNYLKVADNIDVTIFEKEIIKLREADNKIKALGLCNILLSMDQTINNEFSTRMTPIFYLQMLCHHSDVFRLASAYTLNKRLKNIHKSEYQNARLSQKIVKYFEFNVNNIIHDLSKIEQVQYTDKRYKRNERVKVEYKDGKVEIKKYKLIEEKVKTGECKII